jgi:hypothetical protein
MPRKSLGRRGQCFVLWLASRLEAGEKQIMADVKISDIRKPAEILNLTEYLHYFEAGGGQRMT